MRTTWAPATRAARAPARFGQGRPAPYGWGGTAAAAGKATGPPLRLRCAVAARRAERCPGVIRHLARPDELPERRQRLLALEPRRLEQVVPEERLAAERGLDRNRLRALRAR